MSSQKPKNDAPVHSNNFVPPFFHHWLPCLRRPPVSKCFGKKPARPNAVKFKLTDYLKVDKITLPDQFGHENLVSNWGLFANDRYGDCFWAGSAHEVMMWNKEAGNNITFTDANVLSDYGWTGFKADDPSSDQGTDMQQGASYRQKVGIIDSGGKRHKVAAYLAIEPGNVHQHLVALYLFGAVGIGINVPQSAESQFDQKLPWTVVDDSTLVGDHYVPLVAKRKNLVVVTWGQLQEMTEEFLQTYNDESVCYLSTEMLTEDKSPEGFNSAQLLADLQNISQL